MLRTGDTRCGRARASALSKVDCVNRSISSKLWRDQAQIVCVLLLKGCGRAHGRSL